MPPIIGMGILSSVESLDKINKINNFYILETVSRWKQTC